MHGRGRGTTFSGVYIGQDASLTAGTVSPGSNINAVTIEGCTIDSVSRPILVAGRPANTQNIQVLEDTLGNPTDPTAWAATSNIGAVHLRGVQNPIVQGCVVHGESSTNTSVAGIRLDSCENFTITQNWVYNIQYTGTGGFGSFGIFIALPSAFIGSSVNNVVSNNMLAGLSGDGDANFLFPRYIPAGIFVEAASGSISDAKLALIHNSIHLFGSASSNYTGGSAGIAIRASVQGGVKIDGNLIQNTFDASGSDIAYGLVIATGSPSTAGFDINYNQYYLGGSASQLVYARVGTTLFPTFSGWQISTIPNIPSPDANGLVHVPGPVPFVSNIDLHLVATAPSSAINAGNTAYMGAFDFDGEERPLPTNPPGSVNNPPDPGTAPDVGADELDGTPFSCPSSLQAPDIVVTNTYPPLAGSAYLWGQQVEIDTTGTNSPTPSGTLTVIYSLNGGPWNRGPSVSSIPTTFTLPPLTPPTYTGTLEIAVIAEAPAFCNLTADTSNRISINLTDRPGNRAATAIPISLTSSSPGIWTFTISDSTSGPGLSNEYTGLPRAQASRDLFFRIQLPACLDSLDISLCGTTGTLSDSYIHLINATAGDTIDSDDGCSVTDFLSRIVAIGTPNANTRNANALSRPAPARDSLLLVQGHTLYLVVEGYNLNTGTFTVNITGYKMRPSSINVTGAPPSGSVCVNSAPITLDATTPGATAYQWLDANGNPIATGATYTIIPPNAEGSITVSAVAVFNPNNDPSCPTSSDSVTSSVTIIVEDTARAQIADAINNPVSNQTLLLTAGSSVTLNVSSSQASGNSYTWNLYNSIPPSGTPISTSPLSSLTIPNISAGDYTVVLEAVRGSGACGPTRDTVFLNVCPSSLQAPEIVVTSTYPPLAGSNTYLWGQRVEIDTTGTNSPTPSGTLNVIYSLDNGNTWTALAPVTSFPVTVTLPPVTPPNYTPTMLIAVRASAPALCNLTADTSNNPVSINLTDRPGNRADNAITINLTSSGSGMWTATRSDSTSGPGLSDEYTGLPRAQSSQDLFFRIQLPACLDSLDISLCGTTGTLTDSYIHLINATAGDTIDSDDGCSTGSLSRIVAIGTPNANTRNADPSSQPARDSLLLVQGHTLYLVVEGNSSATGTFTVNITGYKMSRPSSISVSGAPTSPVCRNSPSITLTATSGATTYIWKVNGTPQANANTATFNFSPTAEDTFNITATAVFNPNDDQSCPTSADSVTSQPVTIIVEDTARAQIADANNNPVGGGRTLSFTAGSTVTLRVRSPQTTGNTYTWERYNSIPPSGTPTRSQDNPLIINNISAGSYTVILKAVRGVGACDTTRDTVYLSVTTGLRTDAGTFSIFPNPNTGAFTIVAPAMDTYRVQVLDVAGRLVAEDAFTGITHQMRLTLPAGVYQIRLVAGDKTQIGRLIITE